ncbi:MAG: DUF2752 domain-containing protein [Flavobacteriales bacterium]
METIVSWLENHTLTCWMKALTGMDCPGCGFQRSLILLLKGDLVASFLQYPALLPVIALFVILILHLIFKFQKGPKILIFTFIVTQSLVFGNYFLRMAL